MMRSICIIPARSGSKRITNKNIIDFQGKPLLAWTIEAALKSENFDKVVVSTDSREIAEVATANGAWVPKLRVKYADDQSPVSLATLDALEETESILDAKFDIVSQLMPNCPFRDHNTIKQFQRTFVTKNCASLISCSDFGWHKPWWAFELEEDLSGHFLFPEMLNQRSQDLKSLYSVSGAIWSIKSPLLKKHKSFYIENVSFCPIDRRHAVDIDTYDDLNFALDLKQGV